MESRSGVLIDQPYKIVEKAAAALVPHGVPVEVELEGVRLAPMGHFVSVQQLSHQPDYERKRVPALARFLRWLTGCLAERSSVAYVPELGIRFCHLQQVRLRESVVGDGTFVRSNSALELVGVEEVRRQALALGVAPGTPFRVRAKLFGNGALRVEFLSVETTAEIPT